MLFFTPLSSPRADDALMLVVLLGGLLLCAFLTPGEVLSTDIIKIADGLCLYFYL